MKLAVNTSTVRILLMFYFSVKSSVIEHSVAGEFLNIFLTLNLL